jgi:tetratricopeptide (TPR) repeat protein
MPNESDVPETFSNKAWAFLMSWTGRITAIVGLFATIAGGVTWLITHHRQQRERSAQLALAQTQAAQGDYQKSIETYADVLKSNPLDRTALDGQLNTAMLWTENFSVIVPEGESAAEPAGRALDEMMPILQSGLTRSKGTRAADVEAHLGWAHWLNQRFAEREFGSAAEQNFRAALAIDPGNVYANAMLGNWMLQNGGNFSEVVQHFHAAVDAGKALPFVRALEIGGLTGYDKPGSRGELMRILNSMRLHGEPLDSDDRRRVFGFCCDIEVTDHAELFDSLSAVPAQEAWQTYLWLESYTSDDSPNPIHALIRDYIQASLLEISGQRQDALRQYRTLQQKLPSQLSITLQSDVNSAVKRLEHP